MCHARPSNPVLCARFSRPSGIQDLTRLRPVNDPVRQQVCFPLLACPHFGLAIFGTWYSSASIAMISGTIVAFMSPHTSTPKYTQPTVSADMCKTHTSVGGLFDICPSWSTPSSSIVVLLVLPVEGPSKIPPLQGSSQSCPMVGAVSKRLLQEQPTIQPFLALTG